MLVNPTGGQIGEGEGIGVAVFLTFFFFFFTGFFVEVDALGFLVEFTVGAFVAGEGLIEFFETGVVISFLVEVTLLLGFGVGVTACTLDTPIAVQKRVAIINLILIPCSI